MFWNVTPVAQPVWLVSALVLACAGCGRAATQPPARTPAKTDASAPEEPRTLSPSEIAERASPSVVSIRGPDSIGTGFVVRGDGWIATNLHVVATATDVAVVTADGEEYEVVEVLAMDPQRDLILLRIDVTDLPELAVGDSDAVRPGDAVVAIGHPLGLQDTVSNGLVSAVRKVDPKLTLLQISAPIAPGSSGGPLIDDRGNVIGIATAITRGGQNLNFGVPTRYLVELIDAVSTPLSWDDFVGAREAESLPEVERRIPKHPLSLLKGCGEGDLRLLGAMISEAIAVGAPLYNQGNFAACYHVYEGAAQDAERRLGASCFGPKQALVNGRNRAARLSDPSAQAWAMRDAFDGLKDVIARKLMKQ